MLHKVDCNWCPSPHLDDNTSDYRSPCIFIRLLSMSIDHNKKFSNKLMISFQRYFLVDEFQILRNEKLEKPHFSETSHFERHKFRSHLIVRSSKSRWMPGWAQPDLSHVIFKRPRNHSLRRLISDPSDHCRFHKSWYLDTLSPPCFD